MSNYTRHAKTGDYKPQRNSPCLNLCTAIIDEYKRSPKRLKTIYLDSKHFRMINNELSKLLGAEYKAVDRIEFDGCDVGIEYGGKLQLKAIRYEFYPAPPKATVGEVKQQLASC
jgi:hypothetical protein